jgi:hypothetical protein
VLGGSEFIDVGMSLVGGWQFLPAAWEMSCVSYAWLMI